MRRLLLSSLFLTAAPAAAVPLGGLTRLLPEPVDVEPPAYFDVADVAALDLREGRYRRVLWSPDAPAEARAEALLRLGNHAAAREATDDSLLLARVDLAAGDVAAARERLAGVIESNPESIPARLLLGQAAEQVGDLDAAVAAYGWFEERRFLPQIALNADEPPFDDADALVSIGVALDRLATLTAAYRDDPSLHDAILDLFVTAYDVVDRGHADAHVAAAAFAYERSDTKAALEELEAALQRNPRHAGALRLLGAIHLDRFGFDEVEAVLTQMRSTDPRGRDADLLEARSLLRQRQPEKAEPIVRRVLDARPDDLEALGLLASAQATRLLPAERADTLAKIEAIDPDNAMAYLEIGEQLAILRQYGRAAEDLRTAADRAAWWTRPLNQLGVLYTQSGEEAAAVAALQQAVALDPFNAETRNYLRLLEEMRDYERVDAGPRFVVRHADDPLVAELMAATLGEMGEEVDGVFGWSPPVATEIQVFPTHDRFSVRVAGDPYVGTVGACTGPVIAMVAPRDAGDTLGAYDWLRVLRHEYAHTVTLGATDNRIWHWLTEGFAVREEHRPDGLGAGAPPREGQIDLLAKVTAAGELFAVEDLTWGFVRPRKPTDRSQAYAQSWQVCEYVAERWGEAELMALMHAAGRGLTERAALDEVLDITPESFDADFAAWMAEKLADWGYDPAATLTYGAKLAEGDAALRAKNFDAAIEAYAAAREIRPYAEDPAKRLAGLYLTTGRDAEAAGLLLWLAKAGEGDNRYAKRAARLFLDAGDAAGALDAAWLAVRAGATDPAAHELLLAAAELAGDAELAAAQRGRLATMQ